MIANKDDVRLEASQYARAITRWENEGGAPEYGTSKTGAQCKVELPTIEIDRSSVVPGRR
jgi:hypothetical protein